MVSEILRKEGIATERVPFDARGACHSEVGGGKVGKIDADYLGGEKPGAVVSAPSDELHADKERFTASRRDRWFRAPGAG